MDSLYSDKTEKLENNKTDQGKGKLDAYWLSMSLVSLSTAFIMAWFEGNFLSPKKQKKENGVKYQDVTGEKSDHLQKLNSLTFEDTGDAAGLYFGLGMMTPRAWIKPTTASVGCSRLGGNTCL